MEILTASLLTELVVLFASLLFLFCPCPPLWKLTGCTALMSSAALTLLGILLGLFLFQLGDIIPALLIISAVSMANLASALLGIIMLGWMLYQQQHHLLKHAST